MNLTMPISMVVQIIAILIILILVSFLAGIMLPDSIAGKKNFQKLVFGFGVLLVSSGLVVHYDVPAAFRGAGTILSSIFIIFLCVFLDKRFRNGAVENRFSLGSWFSPPLITRQNILVFLQYFFLIIGSACIFVYPEFQAGTVLLHNRGPDFDGHLLGASYLSQGGSRLGLLSQFSPFIDRWDSAISAWDHPNFINSAAFEVIVRANRVGYAGLVATLSKITQINISTILYSTMCFASFLTSGLIFSETKKNGSFIGFLAAGIFIFSQSLLIQKTEGIVAQLITLPLITLILLLIVKSSFNRILGWVGIGLVLTAISGTFGEGSQIILLLLGIFFGLKFIEFIYYKKINSINSLLYSGAVLMLSFIVFDQFNTVEFIKWTIFRINSKFSGGALHFNWSTLDVLLNFPHFHVLKVGSSELVNYSIAPLILMAYLVLSTNLKSIIVNQRFIFIAVALSTFVPLYLNHSYAFWKCLAIFSPYMVCFCYSLKPSWRFRNINSLGVAAFIFLLISLWGYSTLSSEYIRFGQRVFVPEVVLDRPNQPEFAFVTLQTDGFVYYRFGEEMPLFWLNSGWGAKFNKYNKASIPVYGLLDCANYNEFCKLNERGAAIFFDMKSNVSRYINKNDEINLSLAKDDFYKILSNR